MNLRLSRAIISLRFLAALAAVLAALLALSLSAGSSADRSDDSGASPTPTPFVPPPECDWNTKLSGGERLAFRLLSLEDGPLVLDGDEWRSLADEIDGVLARVFASSGDVPSVSVRETYIQGRVSIGLEPGLGEALNPLIWGADHWPPISFGDEPIDSLNAKVGLAAILSPRDYTSVYSMTLCLDPLVNVRATSRTYAGLAGLKYASGSALIGDSSDIAVKPANESWYVVLRDAFGDCPAGCTGQDLFYFTVTDAEVIQLCEEQAWQNPTLLELAGTWSEGRLPAEARACDEPTSLPKTGGHPGHPTRGPFSGTRG